MKDFKICEVFYSVQGEGINVGIPSVFVRFFGCNLQCNFCDTKYSWKSEVAQYKNYSVEDLRDEILQYEGAQNIVFTGGEPALFQNEILEIVELLKKSPKSPLTRGLESWTFELETNGAFEIKDDFWDVINISPKLSNSGNKPYVVKAFDLKNQDKIWWKFVVNGELDMQAILDFQKKHEIDSNRVLLMPQAQTKIEIEKKSPVIIGICKKYGFRFCPRLHIFIYSDKKGV